MSSELKTRHNDHEQYEELIALYSTGELTDNEVQLLTGHLRNCDSCREDLAQYRTAFRTLAPTAFFNRDTTEPFVGDSSWSPQAKKRLLKGFEAAKDRGSFGPVAVPNVNDRGFDYSGTVPSPFWKVTSLALLLLLLIGGALIT